MSETDRRGETGRSRNWCKKKATLAVTIYKRERKTTTKGSALDKSSRHNK